jgi:hypothetical protein
VLIHGEKGILIYRTAVLTWITLLTTSMGVAKNQLITPAPPPASSITHTGCKYKKGIVFKREDVRASAINKWLML